MTAPPPDAQERAREFWQELLDKDDRTSPEEYPEMALISFDELAAALRAAEAGAIERAAVRAETTLYGDKFDSGDAFGLARLAAASDIRALAAPSAMTDRTGAAAASPWREVPQHLANWYVEPPPGEGMPRWFAEKSHAEAYAAMCPPRTRIVGMGSAAITAASPWREIADAARAVVDEWYHPQSLALSGRMSKLMQALDAALPSPPASEGT